MRLIPFLWVLLIIACDRPESSKPKNTNSENQVDPVVFYTSLEDSIPQTAMQSLHLGRVTGIKVKSIDGNSVSYFEYQANKRDLLRVISQLPFSTHGVVADTLCRRVNYDDYCSLRSLTSAFEQQKASSFWNIDTALYEVYECIKSPQKHLLVVSKNSDQVYHRIEIL